MSREDEEASVRADPTLYDPLRPDELKRLRGAGPEPGASVRAAHPGDADHLLAPAEVVKEPRGAVQSANPPLERGVTEYDQQTPALADSDTPLNDPSASGGRLRRVVVVGVLCAAAGVVALAVTLALRPELGALEVRSEPPGAEVSVDGVSMAASTPIRIRLEPGDHQLKLERAGFRGQTFDVQVAPGQVIAHRVVLTPISRAGFLTVSVFVEPPGAEIGIDDRPAERAWRVRRFRDVDPRAAHLILVRAEGHEAIVAEIPAGTLKSEYRYLLRKTQ